MYRTALRSAARPAIRSLPRTATKRFASTASPADRPRSWKGLATRFGLAGAAIYYYNTTSIFADELPPQTVAAPPTFADDELPTVDSVIEEKRKQIRSPKDETKAPLAAAPVTQSSPEKAVNEASQAVAVEEGASALEEEAGQQGAFNPETGEINWDCPCLGGMAHGPCGEEFKTAFSCFVYSNEEPKGMDCIEKFQGMQECFRQYPEIYGAELADEEEAIQQGETEAPAPEADHQKIREDAPAVNTAVSDATTSVIDAEPEAVSAAVAELPKAANGKVPHEWEDATEANVKAEEQIKEEKPGNQQEKEEKKE